jgi:putative ABC transport system substrate-binding protein
MTKSFSIWLLATVLLTTVSIAEAQQPRKFHRIGYLSAVSPSSESARSEALRQGLRELGYIEQQNIFIDYRYAEGKLDQLPALAGELVALKADIILTRGTPPTHAAKQATSTIPIIMVVSADPVGTGLVASLARPGGNVTGITSVAAEITGKRLELLKEVVPRASRVAVLWNSDNSAMALRIKEVESVAGPLGLNLQIMGVRDPNAFEEPFSAMTQKRADALLVVLDPFTVRHRNRIFEYAAKSRLPAM